MLKIEKFKDQVMSKEDFKKKKKVNPYKNMRTNAKYLNFGFLFGSSATAFALSTLKDNWTEKDCDEFIAERKLDDRVFEIIEKRKLAYLDAKLVACAEVLRASWFATYPGIGPWIDRCIQEGIDDGYVRSSFGARRLVPELTYPNGADVNQRHLKNLKNITVNTRVQNHEAVVMNRAQHAIHLYIREQGLKTKLIGNVHDAAEKYLLTAEEAELLPVIHKAFSEPYPENKGIPYEGETNIAYPLQKEYWGFGKREVSKLMALGETPILEPAIDYLKETIVDDFEEDEDDFDFDYEEEGVY